MSKREIPRREHETKLGVKTEVFAQKYTKQKERDDV